MSAHGATRGGGRQFGWFVLPAAVQAGLSFIILPFTTAVLNPADFAIHALVAGFAALGAVFVSLSSPYILAHRFPTADSVAREGIVTTLLILSVAASALFSCLFILVWIGLQLANLVPASIPLVAAGMGALVVPLGAPWTIAQELITLKGSARFFAVAVLLQSAAGTAVTLTALFYFKIGFLALFAGGLAAAAVAGLLGLTFMLPYLGATLNRTVVKETATLALPLLFSNGLDAAFVVLERTLLAASSGLTAFGIFSHSQQYMAVCANGIKALIRSVWPISLAEARDPESKFLQTGSFWRLGHTAIVVAGVFFATLGETAIGLLTNEKFNDAHLFAAAWMALLLWQQSGRPQQAMLFAHGRGDAVAAARVRGTLAGAVFLPPLALLFGLPGAAAARFVQAGTIRWGFGRAARRLRPTPWQDQLPVVGTLLIATSMLPALLDDTGIWIQSAAFGAGCIAAGISYGLAK